MVARKKRPTKKHVGCSNDAMKQWELQLSLNQKPQWADFDQLCMEVVIGDGLKYFWIAVVGVDKP